MRWGHAMLNDREFDKIALQENWGAIALEAIPPQRRSQYEWIRNYFEEVLTYMSTSTRPGHKVFFGFVSDKSFNAFAATGAEDFIGIHAGLVEIIRNAFNRIINSRRFMPEFLVGFGEGGLQFGAVDLVSMAADLYVEEPSDSKRKSLSDFMQKVALRFFVLHEFGHIWNGHTSFDNKEVHQLKVISELRAAGSVEERAIEDQTLEMDADAFAVGLVLEHAESGDDYELPIIPDLEQIRPGASRIFFALVSLYYAFRIFDVNTFQEDDYKNLDHPPIPARIDAIMNTAVAYLNEKMGWEIGQAAGIVLISARMSEKNYIDVTGKNKEEFDTSIYTNDLYEPYRKLLLKEWHRLYPLLNKSKRGGNLAPPREIA